jgi:hypothetical protein
MTKRVRPTVLEMRVLQRNYEAVSASLNRVITERQSLEDTIAEMRREALWKETVAANIISGLRDEINEMAAKLQVQSTPTTVVPWWRSIFS